MESLPELLAASVNCLLLTVWNHDQTLGEGPFPSDPLLEKAQCLTFVLVEMQCYLY